MAYSDPYEEWKQSGRPGGVYRPPTGAPQQQPQLPPPPPNARPAQGSTTPPATVPPAPPAGPRQPTQAMPAPLSNGVNLEQAFATQRTGGNAAQPSNQWRDTDQYSQAQWGAWEEEERQRAEQGGSAQTTPNKYNPDGKGCPPNMPFTSRPGPDGKVECAYKPDDCPDGSHVVGTPGRCVPNGSDGAGGAGGGGVGGGGAAGGGAGAGLGGSFEEMNQWWKNQIQNGTSRYSPETMAALESDAFARARRQEKLEMDAARQDMAQRGVSRSRNMAPVERDIRANASQNIAASRSQVLRAKIDADYQDKQAAIKNAESWVNSMRDFLLRSDANAIQREQIAAQIRLAMQNISAQKDLMEQSYKNNLNTVLLTQGF